MMNILLVLMALSLFVIFCFRHFFIQLVGLKLFLDAAVVFFIFAKAPDSSAVGTQSAAALISGISILVFFILMAAGIQRFARSKNSSLEVRGD